MRKTLFVTLLVLISLSSTAAQEADWRPYSGIEGAVLYYDRQSIKSMSNNIWRVWTKEVIKTEERKDFYIKKREEENLPTKGYEDLSYTVNLFEINCITAEMRLINWIDYNTEKNRIASGNVMTEWSAMPPDSIGYILYKIVCKSKGADNFIPMP